MDASSARAHHRHNSAPTQCGIIDDAPTCVLYGKTGLAVRADTGRATDLGWIVGWVERDGRRWLHAVNLDLHDTADAGKRTVIARALLARSGALPTAS